MTEILLKVALNTINQTKPNFSIDFDNITENRRRKKADWN